MWELGKLGQSISQPTQSASALVWFSVILWMHALICALLEGSMRKITSDEIRVVKETKGTSGALLGSRLASEVHTLPTSVQRVVLSAPVPTRVPTGYVQRPPRHVRQVIIRPSSCHRPRQGSSSPGTFQDHRSRPGPRYDQDHCSKK